jgi:uncharacterized delta-60 repeat protein
MNRCLSITLKRCRRASARAAWALMCVLLTVVLAAIHSPGAQAILTSGPGSFDTTFGTGGVYSVQCYNSTTDPSVVRAVVVQPDGKIVLAGYRAGTQNSFCLARLNADGSKDTTFRSGVNNAIGFASACCDMVAYALALQPEGKIVSVGSVKQSDSDYDFVATRHTSTGVLDTTFGIGGIRIISGGSGVDEAVGVVVQPDGKIMVGGYCGTPTGRKNCIYRLDSVGSSDSTFGTGFPNRVYGTIAGTATGMVGLPDGGVAIASLCGGGGRVCVERFTADGALNLSVTSPRAVTDVGGIALQGDGSFVVAASCDLPSAPGKNGFCPLRISASGSTDVLLGLNTTEFAGFSATARSIQVQADGNVVVLGQCREISSQRNGFCVARYSSDGQPDRIFYTGGTALVPMGNGQNDAYALAIQPDGKLVAAGACEAGTTQLRFCVTRLQGGPSLHQQCSFDLDGDGRVTPKDALIAMRVAIGVSGRAVFSGIDVSGASRGNWLTLRPFLIQQCGLDVAL